MKLDYDSDRLIRDLKEFLDIPREIVIERHYDHALDGHKFHMLSPDRKMQVSYFIREFSMGMMKTTDDQITFMKNIMSKLWAMYQDSLIEKFESEGQGW